MLRSAIRRKGGAVFGLALAALCATACNRAAKATPGDTDARTVTLSPVKDEDVTRVLDIVGTLAAEDEVTLASEVEGRVARIHVELGDRVSAGQPLIELDRERLQYRLDQQRAALSSALARSGASSLEADVPPLERVADVQRAAAELTKAEQAFQRASELHGRALLPRQQLEDAESELKARRAAHDAALQEARNVRADIEVHRANLRLAERDLRDATLRAPFDAYVQRRLVSPGALVQPDTPLIGIVKVDPLKLTAEVPERMAPWVTVGQALTLSIDAFPDVALTGTIVRASPAVNQQTRAFTIEGRVPNRDALLKPGTFARVRIVTNRVERIRTVPASALQYRYGVNRVFVVTGDRLASREVKVGDRMGDRVEIVEGLQGGESIVVSDVERLAEGQVVQVSRGE